jgi:indole-3-glycerol phosphate synthase
MKSLTVLEEILSDVRHELASARAARPPSEIRARLAGAPPPRPFAEVLECGFRLIAEIKERSPSVGPMRAENVAAAPAAYGESPVVAAVSVLTNATHFGMGIQRLEALRGRISKPLLRKEFILDEYQIREARAFGADAVLLMANVLDRSRLAGFSDLALELGMQAVFEIHEEEEIGILPPGARLVGINSRKFKAAGGFVGREGASATDFSLDFSAFALVDRLPPGCLKIAESGLRPDNAAQWMEHFDAGLVGTSLLRDPRGPAACLGEFHAAITQSPRSTPRKNS